MLYPFQTFSFDKEVDFSSFPLFIEGSDPETEQAVTAFAKGIGPDVRTLNSADRSRLHISAVFACNFTNHLYHIAEQLLNGIGMDFKDIKHLSEETLHKAIELSPSRAQTGPAIRGDKLTLEAHLEMIEDENIRRMYELISKSIRNF